MPMTPWSAVRWLAGKHDSGRRTLDSEDLVLWSSKARELRDRLVQRPLTEATLATLQGGQAVYAPPDGQRTADLDPAGAEVPT